MTKLESLRALEAKVEAGDLSPRRIDAEVDAVLRIGTSGMRTKAAWAYKNFSNWRAKENAPGSCEVVDSDGTGGLHWKSQHFSTSLDAANSLHEAVLPADYGYLVGPRYAAIKHTSFIDDRVCDATSTSPARAWLLAIIRALISETDGDGHE